MPSLQVSSGRPRSPPKKREVERVEDFFEVVEVALRAGVALAAARVADEFSLAGDGGAGGEALEAHVVRRIDGLLVEFGEKNMRDGADDALGSAFDEIGEADEDFTFAQADGGVQRCEAAEANREWEASALAGAGHDIPPERWDKIEQPPSLKLAYEGPGSGNRVGGTGDRH